MNPDFHAQVNAIWRQQFDIPADQLDQPGTSVIPEPDTYHDDWLGLWPVGARIVIESPPALLDDLRRVAADHPADHQLTVADLQAGLGSRVARTESMPVYMLDAATFTRIMPDDRYTVRALTPADQVAFDVFQDHCTPD
ncbi:MAG: hypothetical protein JXQ72_05845, partial [Anaerolineae bacterium]|nr:hypothetical protein [Anaerolineae bacterium]